MSTSVTNMGGFLAAAILQPMVGWVMDSTWQGGLTAGGCSSLHAGRFSCRPAAARRHGGLGALASWRIRETHCRNVWQSPVGLIDRALSGAARGTCPRAYSAPFVDEFDSAHAAPTGLAVAFLLAAFLAADRQATNLVARHAKRAQPLAHRFRSLVGDGQVVGGLPRLSV
jgi:hypothetical protein